MNRRRAGSPRQCVCESGATRRCLAELRRWSLAGLARSSAVGSVPPGPCDPAPAVSGEGRWPATAAGQAAARPPAEPRPRGELGDTLTAPRLLTRAGPPFPRWAGLARGTVRSVPPGRASRLRLGRRGLLGGTPARSPAPPGAACPSRAAFDGRRNHRPGFRDSDGAGFGGSRTRS